MLSPLDLQNKRVVTKKRKYDKEEMDDYLDLVFENYKALYDENQELQKQVKSLNDGIQYYRSIETTMQKALVLAEKTSKETKDAAILKAEAIEKDASTRAAKIVSDAESEYDKIKDKCLTLMQQFNQYKMQLKQVATAQLELVTSESFDVYVPEMESLQRESTATIEAQENSVRSEIEEPEAAVKETTEDEEKSVDVSDLAENDNLDKTTILPDIKKEIAASKPSVDEEEAISILTADTIDLSDSIQMVRAADSDEFVPEDKEETPNRIQTPKKAKPKPVQDALVVEPVDAKPVKPLDAELSSRAASKAKKREVLEPIPETDTEAPTLDSLLQSMNMSKKNKTKKGQQDEDPFEFLGSVDDF